VEITTLAVARDCGITDWPEPLVITTKTRGSNKQIFRLYLLMDRLSQTIQSRIEEEHKEAVDKANDDDNGCEGEEEGQCREKDSETYFIEIEVRFSIFQAA
jgi:hypothetical protein